MRRTQLYLDEALWKALHLEARRTGTSISELVRQSVRARYQGSAEARKSAMLAFAGSWSGRDGLPSTAAYVRQLRRGSRLARWTR